MGERFRIHHAAAFAAPVAGLFLLILLLPEAALAAELRRGLRAGLGGVAQADTGWLVVTGLLLGASLAGSALAWRAALRSCGARCGPVDAVARYGVGSLANAVLPAKVGGVIRIALFSRRVHGEGAVWTTGGAAAVAGIARALWLSALVAAASTTGVLPTWPAFALVAAGSFGIALALVARRTRFHARAAHVLDAFRALLAEPRAAAAVVLWVGAAIGARVAAASALALAFGVERPLAAGLLAVAAIELVAMLPVSLGSAGMAGGALAFALSAHGVANGVAVSAGIAFAAAETATAVTVGGLGGLLLALPAIVRWVGRGVPEPVVAPVVADD
ncbi:MAG TPA: lysylphosphatidylglycerol synthase domain-containing protein [Gaiella sp.]|nr:lysylphosphatidylglycerol synthase domain-containing protein [Gaiella sp.]